MKIKNVMICNPYTVRYDQSLADASRIYLEHDVNCAPVVGVNKDIVGIITISKVLESFLSGSSPTAKINEFMDEPPGVVSENTEFENLAKNCPQDMERMLVLDQNKKLTGILSRVELIKKVNLAWEETRNELKVVLQSVSHAIIAFDKTGAIYLFNKGAEILLGISSKEAIDQRHDGVLPEWVWKEVIADGQARFGFRFQVNNKRVIGNATPINVNGNITGTVVVLQDLSEMESLTLELSRVRELKVELDNIIECSYDGMLVVNTERAVLRANKSALQLLNRLDYSQYCVLRDIKSEVAGCLDEMSMEIIEQKKTLTKVYTKADGQEIMITGNPRMSQAGQVIQVIFNMRDMTELQRLKFQVEQAKEEKLRYSVELLELRGKLLKEDLITISSTMEPILELMLRVSQVDSTVLITGESGVGKEVAAKRIHKLSRKENGPFITINCGAIPENLMESELFGYEKGAFTGASKEGKIGLMEAADGGNVFLDEIGELPLNLQVKLLRVLQEKVIYRIGGIKPININVRIIAATNRNLKDMVKKKTFREDLFYRLNVVQIEIPPLRARKEDILPLSEHFLKKYCSKYDKQKRITQQVYRIFECYHWPGNIRELENVIERAVILSQGEMIEAHHLPENLNIGINGKAEVEVTVRGVISLDEGVQMMEKELLRKALGTEKSSRKTAQLLGITHTTVLRKAKQYNLL
ncbi:transcriptional regulator containing PAS, AAA-type ATPase, and DNA-binding domains [Desulfosporosinus orientis DSM 765]|uniref:HTH-type transcriptional regulatory protein TyrR n=1 Tax=Desulfosporosinus orientis (strain ATCC 19365 / DSM 765 / NCIMB 8382 / VKM B-1628 / Singapore I) TaxID=768706 RepID=G7WGY9_DESOD|nr:sigma 54-interacting transcriptional regulator [Desulfosporosinus orientis]AET69003.1 transcriptional regulator containing PAS, AAA-type ATPase, and DNA-binding domains [Desulfosporosinus orientis DSM 765]